MEIRPYDTAPRWQRTGYSVIFESDTRAGRAFDLGLLVAIELSVLSVMLESVQSMNAR